MGTPKNVLKLKIKMCVVVQKVKIIKVKTTKQKYYSFQICFVL